MCIYIYVYIYMFIYIYVYKCIYIYVNIYIYMYIYSYIYVYIYVYLYVYIYIHIHQFYCINSFVWYNTSILRSWNFMKVPLDNIHPAQTAAPHVPRLRPCARQASHRCRWYQDIEVSSVASGVAGLTFWYPWCQWGMSWYGEIIKIIFKKNIYYINNQNVYYH